jgi:adenylate cyclase
MAKSKNPEEWWHRLLTGENPDFPISRVRYLLRFVPSNPRCSFCNAPYGGFGASLMRLVGKGPSRLTPHLCQQCQSYASRYLGGAEIELSMLFADVRGSTELAGKMSTVEFSQIMSRFFAVSSDALTSHNAWVDRFVGDQVVGYFVPGFAGQKHGNEAILAAQELLRNTGHGNANDPWVPVGIGIHTGKAFVGSIGAENQATDITALGDAANIAARLSSAAKTGEILISEPTVKHADLSVDALEKRILNLKGISHPTTVYVVKASGGN